jgi:hypothetical protein
MQEILTGRVGLLWGKPKKSSGGEKRPDLTNEVTRCELPANVNDELLKAIDLALADQWDSAHQIVQQYEDSTAAWIHAALHKIEGDQDNSRYWYRRAGKLERFSDEPKQELAVIRKEIAARV